MRKVTEQACFDRIMGELEEAENFLDAAEYDGLLRDVFSLVHGRMLSLELNAKARANP